MRGIRFLICLSLIYALPAQATVYEYGDDGSVLTYEAFDYRSTHGEGQFEVFTPAPLLTTPALPSFAKNGNYDFAIQHAALTYGVDAALLHAVIGAESAGKPDAISPKGAQGLMQLMPATAKQYGVLDPFDPEQNIAGGARYLGYLFSRYQGDTRLALAAYNAGEGTVDRYGGVPPYAETKAYVKKIERVLKDNLKN